MAMSSAKVVIVGAGVAGMTAAAWLINNKVEDIIILEAQDYVGGRVKAEVVDGRNIDLGAQFVHGRKGNPAFEIAEKLGLVLFPEQEGTMIQNWPREFLTTAGEKIPAKTTEDLLQFLQDELNARFDDIQKDDRGSDGEYFERAYRKYLDLHQKDLTPHDKILYDAIFRWHCSYNKIDNAVTDLKQLSAWGASEYKVLPGDRFTDTEGGMTVILDAVSKLVPKDVIRLRTPVKKIDWSATSQSSAADDKVLVTCENGDVIEADHVIVTISLGCLQARHEKMFHPNLPQPFQTAMSHFGYGSIGKCVWTVHTGEGRPHTPHNIPV